MKKTILTIVTAALLISCSKEKDTPAPAPVSQPSSSCNCGLILSDNVQDYSITIRNSCSGNSKKFILQEGDWMNAHVGSNYCITNVTSW